jgi:hypothetical protein
MNERKAVLNVTVAQSVADAIRDQAAATGATISSVVEAALSEQLRRYRKRDEGLAAMDELYQRIGRPTAREEEAAEVWVTWAAGLLADTLADPRDAAGQRASGSGDTADGADAGQRDSGAA